MSRVSINLSADERAAFKIACVENRETMTDAGRKMLMLYSSGLLNELCKMWPTMATSADFEDAAEAIVDWLAKWDWDKADAAEEEQSQ